MCSLGYCEAPIKKDSFHEETPFKTFGVFVFLRMHSIKGNLAFGRKKDEAKRRRGKEWGDKCRMLGYQISRARCPISEIWAPHVFPISPDIYIGSMNKRPGEIRAR